MPRKPIDHTKSLVYKFCKDGNDLYVGSTTSFTQRKSKHKSDCNNPSSQDYNKALYVFIRENGGWDSGYVMVLVQLYPECKSTIELRMYERQHYDIIMPQLNVIRPHATVEETEDDHRERSKRYYNDNKVQIRQYCNDNSSRLNEKHACLCGGQYSIKHRSEHNKTKKHRKYCELVQAQNQAQAPTTTINL